jgi:hypothetical protein
MGQESLYHDRHVTQNPAFNDLGLDSPVAVGNTVRVEGDVALTFDSQVRLELS